MTFTLLVPFKPFKVKHDKIDDIKCEGGGYFYFDRDVTFTMMYDP